MTDRPGWTLWLTAAAILAGPAAIVAVLLLHDAPGGSAADAQPTPAAVNYVEQSALPANGTYTCVQAVDRPLRLRVRVDAPLGGRVLRDDVGKRSIHRIDPATRCPDLVGCQP
jgi:hypothetical protein